MIRLLILCLFVVACASSPQQELIEDILVRRGTSEYLSHRSDPQEHAKNIVRIADTALAVIDGEATTTVDLLYAVVMREAKFDELDPQDRLDAEALLMFLRAYLEGKLGDVEIDTDRIMRVRDFIENVRYVANVYTM